MTPATRLVLAIRWPMVLMTVPYAWLWSGADGSGGALMVIVYALLVAFAGLLLDGALVRHGLDPRLGVRRDRFELSGVPLEAMSFGAGCSAVFAALALSLIQWRLAVVALVAAGLVALLVPTGVNARNRRLWALVELRWALGLFVLPAALAGAWAWNRVAVPEAGDSAVASAGAAVTVIVLSHAALGASGIGALLLVALFLACQRRDEAADRGDGFRTSVAVLGRRGAGAMMGAAVLGAMAVGAYGAARGWWGWWVTTLICAGGLAVVGASSAGHDERAARLAALSGVAVALVMMLTVSGGQSVVVGASALVPSAPGSSAPGQNPPSPQSPGTATPAGGPSGL